MHIKEITPNVDNKIHHSSIVGYIYPLLVCATVGCVLTVLSVYCALNSAPAFILADLALAQILTRGQY